VACITAGVNIHDSTLFPDSLCKLKENAILLKLSLKNIPLTLDPGFDSKYNKRIIRNAGLKPIIKPNFRNTTNQRIISLRTTIFGKIKPLYKLRHTVERGFAWEDKYRKLVIRYERLTETFQGFRYLAAAMVNYRSEVGKVL
jgi:Transposase DDE domain